MKAFSVIELLVVVTLAAILTTATVPNFQDARVRTKIGQARAYLSMLGTALEAYAVDNTGKYPFDLDSRGYAWYVTDVLSTPVPYITNTLMVDPFRAHASTMEIRRYRYINFPADLTPGWAPCPYPGPYFTRWMAGSSQSTYDQAVETFGLWKLSAAGPDGVANSNFVLGALLYDPTNGTVSAGDIIHTQKTGLMLPGGESPQQTQPAEPNHP